jgi:hypothetical protein
MAGGKIGSQLDGHHAFGGVEDEGVFSIGHSRHSFVKSVT